MNAKAMRGTRMVLAALFLAAGAAKLAGADLMIQQFDVIGLGQSARYVVGSFEIIAGLCFLSSRLAVYGALLVSCLTVGAIGATIGHAARTVIDAPAASEPQLTVFRSSQA
jgi:putative oxidoreductase